jgi:N-acyl-D-aspartate/D-glutamate deacylase
MGDRAVAGKSASPAEMAEMGRLAQEAIEAGALGFATSRSLFHRDRQGGLIPTKDADTQELLAIAGGLAAAGRGVIEISLDAQDYDEGFTIIRRLAERTGGGVSFNLFQSPDYPTTWREALTLTEEANRDGFPVKGQFLCRPTGLLLGLNLSFNPFSYSAHYQAIEHLPLAERVAEMRRPEVRERIIHDQPSDPKSPLLDVLQRFDDCFSLGDPPNYEPHSSTSIAAIAKARGVLPQEIAYDMLLADEGKAILFATIANYADRSLDTVMSMFKHPHTIFGLGDGGAHCGVICDAGYPTFMLTYWTRDRSSGERLSVAEVVKALSWDTAQAAGLNDRGLIAPGYKADLNLIDYDRLHLGRPHAVFDLPMGGRRLLQETRGFVRTIVSGVTTYQEGVATGALPGRLVRGPVHPPLGV